MSLAQLKIYLTIPPLCPPDPSPPLQKATFKSTRSYNCGTNERPNLALGPMQDRRSGERGQVCSFHLFRQGWLDEWVGGLRIQPSSSSFMAGNSRSFVWWHKRLFVTGPEESRTGPRVLGLWFAWPVQRWPKGHLAPSQLSQGTFSKHAQRLQAH